MTRYICCALILTVAGARAAEQRGQLDASPTLFTVMAAINAAGFDADANSPNNHPIRAQLRKIIEEKKPESLAEIRAFFKEHRKKNDILEFNQYVSYALAVDGSPDFTFKGRTVEMPPDAEELNGLGPLLIRFARETNLPELWQRAQPPIDQYLSFYHRPVADAVLKVNAYLRNATSGYLGRRFQIYVELLGPPNQVQTRSYGDNYYVVVTPSPEPKIHDIRHAYLHYLLDPLATKNSEILDRKRAISDFAQGAPALDESYKTDFLLLVTESLIKAVEAKLDKDPKLITEALKDGFVLAPYFGEALLEYEKQPTAMAYYFPDMVKAIDLRKEAARLNNVEFNKSMKERVVKTQSAPPPPPVSPAQKTLDEAEAAYTRHDLNAAKAGFLQVLQQPNVGPVHAASYYGLGRVASLEKDPELAQRMFQKALESSPDAFVKGWCLVYLGKLDDASGDRDAAVKHYNEALAVPGASEKTREAAKAALQQKPANAQQ